MKTAPNTDGSVKEKAVIAPLAKVAPVFGAKSGSDESNVTEPAIQFAAEKSQIILACMETGRTKYIATKLRTIRMRAPRVTAEGRFLVVFLNPDKCQRGIRCSLQRLVVPDNSVHDDRVFTRIQVDGPA